MTEQHTREEMRRWARSYIHNGRAVIPVPPGSKNPARTGWQNLEITEEQVPEYWTNGQNIGLKPGEASGNLADVDLDRPEARAVAKYLLEDTRASGREGQELGHRWYEVTQGTLETRKFELPGKGSDRMLVELRWTGTQTLVPPSVYPEGDRCVFSEGDTARIPAEKLIRDVEDTAIAAVLLMHYPGVGARHAFCKHASGYLLRRLPLERVRRIIRAVVLAAEDPELKDRLRLVDDTAEKIGRGEKTTGGPQLERVAGAPVCKTMRGWLGWGEGRDDELPPIRVTDRPLRHRSDDAYAAILERNDPPTLFARSDRPARIGADEKGEPIIQEVGEDRIRHVLTRCANFVRLSGDNELVHVSPPMDVVKDILARPSFSELPPLIGITRVPGFRPDGSLVLKRGYDHVTKMYYAPPAGLTVEVPDNPTEGDVCRAIGLIDEAIGDFPFANQADAANAFALLLTPILRTVIPGPVPLAVVNKPTPGTGGTLLVEVMALITTGRPAGVASVPRDDEEMRKQITSTLRGGNTIVAFDNAEELSHPSLARALTSEIWEDRILGRNDWIKLPQYATWVTSGNNVRLAGDIPRRGYEIRLDAKLEKPWERKDFRQPKLKEWVANQQGQLVGALLTLGRSWFAEDCPVPDGLPILGSFEGWVSVMGGVLENAGIHGFLANLNELHERAAGGAEGWEGFLSAWRGAYGDAAKKTKDVAADLKADEHKDLKEAIPDELADAVDAPTTSLSRRLGKAFSAKEGRRFGSEGVFLKRLPKHLNATRWKVESSPSDDTPGISLISLISSPNPNTDEKQDSNGSVTKAETIRERAPETHQTNETNNPAGGPQRRAPLSDELKPGESGYLPELRERRKRRQEAEAAGDPARDERGNPESAQEKCIHDVRGGCWICKKRQDEPKYCEHGASLGSRCVFCEEGGA